MSGQKIYQRKEYSIYKAGFGYIVHNTNKEFKTGHTHCKNFYKAKVLINLAIKKEIPKKINKWEIESLIRITNDNVYRNKLLMIIDELNKEVVVHGESKKSE